MNGLWALINRLAISVARCWRNFVYNLIASHLRKPILRNFGLKLAQPSHGPLFFTDDRLIGPNRWPTPKIQMILPKSALVVSLLWSIWDQWPTTQPENQRSLVAKDWRPTTNGQRYLGQHYLEVGPTSWSSVWNWPTKIDDQRLFKQRHKR